MYFFTIVLHGNVKTKINNLLFQYCSFNYFNNKMNSG